jgi:hypothetical protein
MLSFLRPLASFFGASRCVLFFGQGQYRLPIPQAAASILNYHDFQVVLGETMRSKVTLALLAGVVTSFIASSALAVQFQTGDVFASVNNGTVDVFRAGVLIQTLNTGQGGFTTGSTTDAAGNFYVTNFSTGSISKFDPTGVSLGVVATGYSNPESIVFAQSGIAYVGQAGSNSGGLGFIGTFNPNNASAVGPLTVSRGTDWVDLASNQTTLLYTSESQTVFRATTAGAQLTPFATGLPGSHAFALRILANGNVLVADTSAALLLSSTGTILHTYTAPGVTFGELFSLNINPDGTSFWTGDDATGILYEFDIATGALITTLNTGVGGSNLFGVSVFGEFTSGGGGVGGGQVPLPAALPLFATGLGALGLLSWRRKRKSAAIAAA